MESNDILRIVNEIFIDVLDNGSIRLTPQTTADDVEEWDSLNHIQLIVAIETRFNIKFTYSQIQKWKNVGDICETIVKTAEK
jgi:acyl carrier protein